METIYWTPETLKEYASQTKDVEINGKFISVCKIPASTISDADSTDNSFKLVKEGLANPKLTIDEVKKLPVDLLTEIVKAITEFSGTSLQDAEKN